MAKIYARNKQYSGISASVPFINGVGSTEDQHLIDWFREHGYKVVEESPVIPKIAENGYIPTDEELQAVANLGEENPQVNLCKGELETLKKEQLQDIATRLELEFNSKTTNAELIEMIKVAREMEE